MSESLPPRKRDDTSLVQAIDGFVGIARRIVERVRGRPCLSESPAGGRLGMVVVPVLPLTIVPIAAVPVRGTPLVVKGGAVAMKPGGGSST